MATFLNVAQLYEAAGGNTLSIMAQIGPQQRFHPTPCSDWNVQTLMNHIVNGAARCRAVIQGEQHEQGTNDVDADEFGPALEGLVALLKEPGTLDKTVTTRRGETKVADFMTNMLMDVTVHGWDLAKATGQDTTIAAPIVEFLFEVFEPRADAMRESGAFGPKQDVAEDADTQTKLLATLGRKV